MKRTIFFAALAAISAVCQAQEGDIEEAIGNLNPYAANPNIPSNFTWSFEFDLTGTQTIGGKTTTFESVLYFNTWDEFLPSSKTPYVYAQVELDHYDTTGSTPTHPVAVLTNRYVGDGQTLWSYDYQALRYSGALYGYYGPAPSPAPLVETYPGNVVNRLSSAVTGPDSYLAMLLKEAYPLADPTEIVPEPTYSSWAFPYVAQLAPLSPPQTDPLDSAWTYPTGADEVVMYGPFGHIQQVKHPDGTTAIETVYGPNTRTVAFALTEETNNSSQWQLQGIHFANETKNTYMEWDMGVNLAPVFPAGTFTPLPPNKTLGWQVVSAPKGAND